MAHTVTSAVVSNQDATPISKIYPTGKGGSVRSAYGYLTVVATTAGQTNCFVRVPTRARLVSVGPHNATMGDGSVKYGFYRPNGGIAVKSDAITLLSALTAKTGANEFTAATPANRSLDIATWLATEIGTAGATSDVELDIVATVVTVSTGTAVAVGLEVQYVLPE